MKKPLGFQNTIGAITTSQKLQPRSSNITFLRTCDTPISINGFPLTKNVAFTPPGSGADNPGIDLTNYDIVYGVTVPGDTLTLWLFEQKFEGYDYSG